MIHFLMLQCISRRMTFRSRGFAFWQRQKRWQHSRKNPLRVRAPEGKDKTDQNFWMIVACVMTPIFMLITKETITNLTRPMPVSDPDAVFKIEENEEKPVKGKRGRKSADGGDSKPAKDGDKPAKDGDKPAKDGDKPAKDGDKAAKTDKKQPEKAEKPEKGDKKSEKSK